MSEKIPKLYRQPKKTDKLPIDTPKPDKPKTTRKKKVELKVSDISSLFGDTQKQPENKPLFTEVNNNHDSDSDNEPVQQPVKNTPPKAPKISYQEPPVKHFFQSNPVQQEQYNPFAGLPIFFRR